MFDEVHYLERTELYGLGSLNDRRLYSKTTKHICFGDSDSSLTANAGNLQRPEWTGKWNTEILSWRSAGVKSILEALPNYNNAPFGKRRHCIAVSAR